MNELPPVREIVRWAVRPGDRLIAIVDRDTVSAEEASQVAARIRALLDLPEGLPVAVASRDWSFHVLSPQPGGGRVPAEAVPDADTPPPMTHAHWYPA